MVVGHRSEAAQVEQVIQDLQRDFEQLPAATVSSEVRQALTVFEGAPIRTYVPVLLQKRVRARLRTLRGRH